MKNAWKKICAVAATVLAFIIAAILGRSLNRRRIRGVGDDIRQALHDAGRASDANNDARNAVADGRRTAGEIANLNRDAKGDVERGREILRNAKARADRARDSSGGG